jgi:5-methylcytosine-specific restriction endonuclease McrA
MKKMKKKLYQKYDPGTYITRDLYEVVCQTRDLRPVWAHVSSQKWNAEYEPFLALCGDTCSCCGSPLDYGLGKNNNDKADVNTPSTDHIVSRSVAKKLGWTEEQINHISNLWIICMRCNLFKNNATPDDIHRYRSIINVLERTGSV